MKFAPADPRNWFCRKRFGMFIHWGVYAVGGIHEQEIWRYNTPLEVYRRYSEVFNPVKFDPARWLDMIQSNGMEYLVFTVKHHDGFCMFDTKYTDYNIMNTPYGRDITAMLAEECHKRNFPLELYYSCVDWHHPAYPNTGRHHEINTDPGQHDFPAYMEFLKAQIKELCTNYGTIHGIWWDMNVPKYIDPSVNDLIRSLQPCAVINNRGYDAGDYSTPERNFAETGFHAFGNLTEACNSLGMNSWGYRKNEDYFSCRKIKRDIALFTSLGGNFLLNAGPDADGVFPQQALDILAKTGKWYQQLAPALTAAPYPEIIGNKSATATVKDNVLYVILLDTPVGGTLRLNNITALPEKAVLLNNQQQIACTLEPTSYTLNSPPCLRLCGLPADIMHDDVWIIELTFNSNITVPETGDIQTIESGSQTDL